MSRVKLAKKYIKFWIGLLVLSFMIFIILSANTSSLLSNRNIYNIRLTYKDSVPDSPRLMYDTGKSYTVKQCIDATITGERQVDFLLNGYITKNSIAYRIDLGSGIVQESLGLESLSVVIDDKVIKTYRGQELIDIIEDTKDISDIKLQDGYVILYGVDKKSGCYLTSAFVSSIPDTIKDYYHAITLRYILFPIVCAVIFFVLGAICFIFRKHLIRFYIMLGKKTQKLPFIHKSFMFREKLSIPRKILYVLSILLLLTAVIVYSVGQYLLKNFDGLSLEEIIFHLKVPKTGTGNDMIVQYFVSEKDLLVYSSCILIGTVVILGLWKPIRNRHFTNSIAVLLSLALLVGSFVDVSRDLNLSEYIKNQLSSSTFIEENYVSPKNIDITFPGTKRNLIFIYLESMETTFISTEEGGCMPENLIPELTQLAKDNINFSESELVGGATASNGSTWTVAAMVAISTGLPLRIPIEGNSYGDYSTFLPGAISLGEILQDNGYTQEIMVGSDLSFGGRRNFYTQHGDYTVYDLFTARKRPDLPDDYYVWWGFEDSKLFSYAKEEITKLSQDTKPFNFTMLTVDTHHVGGYVCELCQSDHKSKYENVLSCSSRQVAAFVDWIKSQDFYENTTIVITGDHPTMDKRYMDKHYDGSKPRKVYNCFINSAVSTTNSKNRDFNTIDLFPTTLAAMGCQIPGERLGLGTNLFSTENTLAEIHGYDKINEEFSKTSHFYKKEILKE